MVIINFKLYIHLFMSIIYSIIDYTFISYEDLDFNLSYHSIKFIGFDCMVINWEKFENFSQYL